MKNKIEFIINFQCYVFYIAFCIHFVNNFAFRNCYTYFIDIKKGENYE